VPQRSPSHTAHLMRKNPELYSALKQSKPDASPAAHSATAVATAADDIPAASAMIQTSSGTPLTRRPEILSPAVGWPQLKAAVENGADAVYFGLSDFNARARAANFDPEELPEVCAAWQYHIICHPWVPERGLIRRHSSMCDATTIQASADCSCHMTVGPAHACCTSDNTVVQLSYVPRCSPASSQSAQLH
jgi:hypothetical protein